MTNIKCRKAVGLDEIPPEVWKTRIFDDILLWFFNAVYKQKRTEGWSKGSILFSKKIVLRITKNYRGLTLTSIAVKAHNALVLNFIKPEIEKILRKNRNGFQGNRSPSSQILTIRWIIEGFPANNLKATLLFVSQSAGAGEYTDCTSAEG